MRNVDVRVVGLAAAATLVSGLLGVPWLHAVLAGLSIVAFRLSIGALAAFRPAPVVPPLAPPASPAPPIPPKRNHPSVSGPGGTLTPRELEAALLLAEGLTNREIGERMFCGESTVDTHLGNVRTKLNVHNRAEIVAVLAEHALLPPRRRQP